MTGLQALTVTTPSPRELVLTRAFDAPRHLVFAALTQPALVMRWLGAQGWNVVECEIDLRVGGRWRYLSRGPGGAEIGHSGVYAEVEAPERLVYTESYDDQWFPGEALVTVRLVERAGRTTMHTTMRFDSQEVRDLVISSPMERGVGEGYERLDAVLAEHHTTEQH